MENITEPSKQPANYYALVRHNLQNQHSKLSNEEISALCREVVFAPLDYQTEINKNIVPITEVRYSLAEFIERDTSNKSFIPYSLDASIADLIENANCVTSSLNEYYRWVSATMDIIRHTTDGDITPKDLIERKKFIGMSYDREAEILLCLALYEGSGRKHNKEKINLMLFKLARLRELRSIVKNTTGHLRLSRKKKLEKLEESYLYCKKLLSQDLNNCSFANLNINIDKDISDDDLDEKYSYLEHIRACILYMMRMLKLPKSQNLRTDNSLLDEPVNDIKPELERPVKAKPEKKQQTEFKVIYKDGKFQKTTYVKE